MISGGGKAKYGFGGGPNWAEISALPLGSCLTTPSLNFLSCKMGMTPRVITGTRTEPLPQGTLYLIILFNDYTEKTDVQSGKVLAQVTRSASGRADPSI